MDSCTVSCGHLRTLEYVISQTGAPTRLNHCLPPMDSESTWFTSVRSLAETDNPGRAQTGTDPVTSPGVSDREQTRCVIYGFRHVHTFAAPTSPTGRASHVHEARCCQCALHRRLLLCVEAAHIAMHLLALALHADGRLPPASGRRKLDPSIAALVA